MAESNSPKWPPKLDNEGRYESWKKDVEIWAKLTDIKPAKQALAIHLSLGGRARIATSELKVEDLNKDNGVDLVISKLDELFLKDKDMRQFLAFQAMYSMRRTPEQSIAEFIPLFEHAYFKYKQEGLELPDTTLGFMLLASSELSETELQLVMSPNQKVTFDTVKQTLKRVFDIGISKSKVEVAVKQEILLNQGQVDETDTFYSRPFGARGSSRGPRRFQSRGRVSYRGSSDASRWYGSPRGAARPRYNAPAGENQLKYDADYGESNSKSNQTGRRRLNPIARDGEISKCVICSSIYHWARQCPDSYESSERDGNEVDRKETENLSMFVAYTNGDKSERPANLLEESFGSCILDTGCLNTVCGEKWLTNYIQSLSDYEKNQVHVNSSSASFTFGDGRKFRSEKNVSIPCHVGTFSGTIKTEVVSADIPLLFGKTSMKRVNMMINTADDSVYIRGEKITLKTASTGHYMLNLSI